MVRGNLLDEVLVAAHNVLDLDGHVDQSLLVDLEERVVLPKNGDRALQRADRLEHVLLLRIELRELFLPQLGRFVKRGLVLGDFSREVLDLSVETLACRLQENSFSYIESM